MNQPEETHTVLFTSTAGQQWLRQVKGLREDIAEYWKPGSVADMRDDGIDVVIAQIEFVEAPTKRICVHLRTCIYKFIVHRFPQGDAELIEAVRLCGIKGAAGFKKWEEESLIDGEWTQTGSHNRTKTYRNVKDTYHESLTGQISLFSE